MVATTVVTGDSPAREDAPLGYAQEMQLLAAGRAHGHRAVSFSARVDGELDLDALLAAIREVVRRHDALRLGLHTAPDGVTRQFARDLPDDRDLVRCVEVANATPDRFDRYARARLVELLGRQWQLADEPPFRFVVLRHSPTVHALLAVFAPIAVDERSRRLIIRELWQCYTAALGGPVPPPDTEGSFLAASAHQRRIFGRRASGASARYWREREQDLAELPVPGRRPAPDADTVASTPLDVRVGEQWLADARRRCDERDITLAHWLFGHFTAAVFDSLDVPWLVVDFPVDMRSGQTSDVVGMFVSTMPIIVRRQDSVPAQVEHLRAALLPCLAHSRVDAAAVSGYRELIRRRCAEDGVPRLAASHSYFGSGVGRPTVPGLTVDIGAYNPKVAYTSSGATLRADEFDSELVLRLAFHPTVFDDAAAAETTRRFARSLGVPA